MPCYDLVLHFLPVTLLQVSQLQWVKTGLDVSCILSCNSQKAGLAISCTPKEKTCMKHHILFSRKSKKKYNSFLSHLLVINGNGYTFWGVNYPNHIASLLGANSFLLEQTLFQKGPDVQESQQEVTKIVSLVKNGGKSTKCIQSP